MATNWLLAAATRTHFEFGRIHSNRDWILPLLAAVAFAFFVRWWYRRDAAELSRTTRWALIGLRLVALAGLLWIYLEPQLRTEHDVVSNSQALVLVDTSLSMGLADENYPSTGEQADRSRRVVQVLSGEKLLNELRKAHDVTIARFDEHVENIAQLSKSGAAAGPTEKPVGNSRPPAASIDWASALAPKGVETRLGQALGDLIAAQHAGPVSGIVLLTDGGQNSGPGPQPAIELARQAGIRVHTVGLGSDRQPVNVRISDLVAPSRAFPRDTLTVTGYIQAQGLEGQTAHLELVSQSVGDGGQPAGDARLEANSDVRLAPDGEVVAVRFDLTPEEIGRRTFTLRVQAAADDANPNDNSQQVDVEIVDQKTRTLVLAGGPTREYRFLHTMLFRDDHMEVDILLGTSQPGISQEANQILDAFPATPQALDKYDVVVAIDPDWSAIPAAAIENLERWVGQQAGGLIVIPGAVFSDRWAERPELAKITDLYPVEFRRRFSLADSGPKSGREPWPLEFSSEGRTADFLWLADSAPASSEMWARFPGVYESLAVRGPKPGATVYARVADPKAGGADEQGVYLCGQFYGSGRVFYLGSGEMWRLRGVEPGLFDQFYTKLIRQVSQGRLLRGTSRGVLLTERERYFLGQTVGVRAQLSSAQLEPLVAPRVELAIVFPDNSTQSVDLVPDGSRPGSYAGQFIARREGVARLELTLPDGSDERLQRRIQVRVPDRERENPRRNDVLLSEIARSTGGKYYVGAEALLGGKDLPAVWTELPDRSLIRPQSDKPRPLWDNWQVLLLISGCLSLEWLVRRLSKLA